MAASGLSEGVNLKIKCANFTVVKLSLPVVLLAGSCTSGLRREMRNELRNIRSVQAAHTAEIDRINESLRQMSGQIEELQHKVVGTTAKLERSISQVSSRVPPPKGVSAELLNEDDELISRNSGEAAEKFRLGLKFLRSGSFAEAKQVFQEFTEENPGTAFTDNGLFWTGVCFEKQGDFGHALTSYDTLVNKYPAEDRAPYALYRIGEVFLKIGSGNEAKDSFGKLVDEYPRSLAAEKARKRLKELSVLRRKRSPRR